MIEPRSSFKKVKKVIAVGVVIALVVLASGCSSKDTDQATAAVTVETQKPVVTTLSKEASFSATLRPQNEITVSPKVAGTVTGVIVKLGDYVEKGDILFVIDDKALSLQVEQAYSGVMTARANYEMLTGGQLDQSLQGAKSALENANIQLETAQTNYDNTSALFEAGAASKQQLDGAERQLRSAKLAFESAQKAYNTTKNAVNPASEQTALAALKQAQAAYDLAADNASNALVKSPISGYITQNTLT
jgi:multidrug resistance efflux pump